jgi:inhibitor of cysteine peptidase
MSKFMPEITVLIICLVLATLPMIVCAKPSTTSQNKIITESNNGNTIYIKEGQVFYMKLKENPSTGYSWQLSLSNGLNQLSDKYYSPESSKTGGKLVIGAAGSHSWEIKAVAKGRQQVNGIYKRSWEKKTGKEQILELNVVVV